MIIGVLTVRIITDHEISVMLRDSAATTMPFTIRARDLLDNEQFFKHASQVSPDGKIDRAALERSWQGWRDKHPTQVERLREIAASEA